MVRGDWLAVRDTKSCYLYYSLDSSDSCSSPPISGLGINFNSQFSNFKLFSVFPMK